MATLSETLETLAKSEGAEMLARRIGISRQALGALRDGALPRPRTIKKLRKAKIPLPEGLRGAA